jgi:hypothetical protein
MRIGTNHGSLSDRIMNRYGDTPRGMVESALEFVRICEAHDYRDLVLSMKASNPLVVQQAYRLLVASMAREGMHYPLHLGVTEAGDGEDGRVKSAMGGLADGGSRAGDPRGAGAGRPLQPGAVLRRAERRSALADAGGRIPRSLRLLQT